MRLYFSLLKQTGDSNRSKYPVWVSFYNFAFLLNEVPFRLKEREKRKRSNVQKLLNVQNQIRPKVLYAHLIIDSILNIWTGWEYLNCWHSLKKTSQYKMPEVYSLWRWKSIHLFIYTYIYIFSPPSWISGSKQLNDARKQYQFNFQNQVHWHMLSTCLITPKCLYHLDLFPKPQSLSSNCTLGTYNWYIQYHLQFHSSSI